MRILKERPVMRLAPLILLHIVPVIIVPVCLLWLLALRADGLPISTWIIILVLIAVNFSALFFLLRRQMKNIVVNTYDVTQNELLAAISDARIGYTVLNDKGEILYASKSANYLMGYSEDRDITGLVWYTIDFENKTLKEARRQTWERYLGDRTPWNGTVRWVAENGEKSYYYYTICSLGEDRIILVVIDRSERIKAARELREREKQHNYVLNNMPIGITLHDKNQKIVYTNSYLADRLGLSIGEIIGKAPSEVLPKDTVRAVHEMYATVLRSKKPVEARPVSVSDGAMAGTEWLIFVYPLFAKGKLDQILVIGLDRTERVRLAREKEQFAQKLFETQKIEALNKFAGGLAHELSNLLHPAGVYARALKEDPDLPNREKYLARINSAVLKSGDIVRRTLSMSRSDKEGPRPLPLGDLLKDLLEYAEDIAPKGLTYDLLIPDLPVIALADETELRQVMMNLMINASHAQGNVGSILITLGRGAVPPASMHQTPKSTGPFAWIDVTDTGIGIDDETRSHIFEPFYTTKEKDEGTGLGLAVVQGIVTGWGGFVTVDTAPGKGSTFRIWIPLAFTTNDGKAARPGERDGQNIGY